MEGGGMKIVYGKCHKNHAARIGQTTTDGCLEYLQDRKHPYNLYCSACFYHRNYHMRSFQPNPGWLSLGNGMERGESSCNIKSSVVVDPIYSTRVHVPEEKTNTQAQKVYTHFQQERMGKLADRLGWDFTDEQKTTTNVLLDFIGISMESFEVWMKTITKHFVSHKNPRLPDLN
ncbi:hypothetical protein FRX31_017705 [Thalictrum thalictroides]|uniref:ZF-HD dimerization-type domain-containing protein n=1 Tax=Thalictrum thalictroides TaxID=46969 RepID=A0A7J6W837_THATH|nr:hypothetical protein FRX31_017705 [Thalictrum thalictroides]